MNLLGRVSCDKVYNFELMRADGGHRLSGSIATFDAENWQTRVADAAPPRVPPAGHVWKGRIRPTHGQRPFWVHLDPPRTRRLSQRLKSTPAVTSVSTRSLPPVRICSTS